MIIPIAVPHPKNHHRSIVPVNVEQVRSITIHLTPTQFIRVFTHYNTPTYLLVVFKSHGVRD